MKGIPWASFLNAQGPQAQSTLAQDVLQPAEKRDSFSESPMSQSMVLRQMEWLQQAKIPSDEENLKSAQETFAEVLQKAESTDDPALQAAKKRIENAQRILVKDQERLVRLQALKS